jgi:hypothetical protein
MPAAIGTAAMTRVHYCEKVGNRILNRGVDEEPDRYERGGVGEPLELLTLFAHRTKEANYQARSSEDQRHVPKPAIGEVERYQDKVDHGSYRERRAREPRHGMRQGQSIGAGYDPVDGILSRQDMDRATEEEPAYRVCGTSAGHNSTDDGEVRRLCPGSPAGSPPVRLIEVM